MKTKENMTFKKVTILIQKYLRFALICVKLENLVYYFIKFGAFYVSFLKRNSTVEQE